MFEFIFCKKRNKKSEEEINKEMFNNIMNFSNSVFNEAKRNNSPKNENHPIFNVIRILGMKLKSDYISQLLHLKHDGRLPNIDPENIFFRESEVLNDKGQSFYNLKNENKVDREIILKLKKDLVLPWPWARDRLINNISSLGKERPWGEWKEDKLNHSFELWLPIGIAWVRGGNHSIAVGIVQGEGELKAKEIYDISPVYDHIYCDGVYYRRTMDNATIEKVKNVEFAAIFEIGRKMKELGISL